MTQSIFGLRFPKGSAAWWEHVSKDLISSDQFFSLPVHPTQLYEICIWIVIGVILLYIRNRQPRKGVITCSFLGLYFLNCFVQDFVRADYAKGLWGLDMMQWLAIGIVPLSGLAILFLYRDRWMGRHSLTTAVCQPEQGEEK